MNTTKSTNVEVAIRVRPGRPDEGAMGWEVEDNTLTERGNPDSSFVFDRVFGPSATTRDIYEKSVKHSIVVHVSNGYSGTVFAYGQTSSGKTFTMLGSGERNPGITAMALTDLFELLERNERPKGYKIRVFLEMIEIYNENLRDLLAKDDSSASQLRIAEDEFGVYVRHAVRREVVSAKDCLDAMAHESQARVVAHTNMNHESSRSHCLIRVTVEKTMVLTAESNKDGDDDDTTQGSPTTPAEGGGAGSRRTMERKVISSLNLVDLAGSERVSKTGADGLRLKEGGLINKSLSTLTNVIMKMSEPRKPGHAWHIPFRDSKLTHLLKTAIGGNSFTTVFCCMTPSEFQVDESRSTLQFAQRAKKIRNEVQMNEVADPRTKIRQLELEIKKMRRVLVANDLYLWSKQIKIKHLQERLGGGGGAGGGGGGGGVGGMGGGEQDQQLVMNLAAENERLRNDLQNALNAVAAMGGSVTTSQETGELHFDPVSNGAGGASSEKVVALERELADALAARDSLQQQVAEMETVLDELDGEAKSREAAKDEQLAQLREQVRAYEVDKQQRNAELASQQNAVKSLRAQLDEACDQLADQARGDELMEKFTELQNRYNELQFEHNTLFEMYEKAEVEKVSKEASLQELLQDAETRCIAVKGEMSTLQGHVWRFIHLANTALGGSKEQQGDAAAHQGGAGHAVRQQQVDHAFRVLSDLSGRRGGVAAFAAADVGADGVAAGADGELFSRGFKRQGTAGAAGHGPSASGIDGSETNPDVLHRKIRELENVIVQKDNHRDVIIDTKLKRMQDLVMRLHTANTTMQLEVDRVVVENKRLHELVARDGKLSAIVKADSLEPASADLIKSSATFAQTPAHPYNHN